jgi:hypothetical protein
MPMRVGAYIDGFNLYYRARDQFQDGDRLHRWKWLDLRSVATSLAGWPGSRVTRVVYCTALRSRAGDPTSLADQEVYLAALEESGSVDHIEYGAFVTRVKTGLLVDTRTEPRAVIAPPAPLGLPARPVLTPDGTSGLLVTVEAFEEKGSDVNVATHLMHDVLTRGVDAAIVVSNDSDLSLPLRLARQKVPVGTVNPGKGPLAGRLRGGSADGVGGHWWRRLERADYLRHQLSDRVGDHVRPSSW